MQQLDRFVRLIREARVDIEWWSQFGQEWNGTSMMWHAGRWRPEVVVTSDASGRWECGAWWESEWFQLQWQGLGESATYGITAKELLPIVVATASWGKMLQGRAVLARCDNMAVVAIVNLGSSREEAMHLRRCLAFLEAKWAIQLRAEHVWGENNEVADAISRNRTDVMFGLHPQMKRRPEVVDKEILKVVVRERQAGRQGSILEEVVEMLFRKGIAPSTDRMYGVARRRYLGFCEKYGRPPLPVFEKGLCQFLAGEGLKHNSIKVYLVAVRQLQVEEGMTDPRLGAMAKLRQVVRGVQRLRAEQGKGQRHKKPMTVEVLDVLRLSWSVVPGGADARMLWAAATLAFFGFMRSGELTVPSTGGFKPDIHLTWQDVAKDCVAAPTMRKVRLKASKTDQVRQGCTLVVGHTGDKLCPVVAVLGFMAVCRYYRSGKPLTQAGFVVELKSALEQRRDTQDTVSELERPRQRQQRESVMQ